MENKKSGNQETKVLVPAPHFVVFILYYNPLHSQNSDYYSLPSIVPLLLPDSSLSHNSTSSLLLNKLTKKPNTPLL